MTELEKWLQARISRAEDLQRQRPVRGDEWYIAEMGKWDFENVQRMHDGDDPLAPDLVLSYREDSRTGHTDGIYPPHDIPEYERYYGQRLTWMRGTLDRLGKGEGPSQEAIERRRLVRVEAEVALIHEEANEMLGLLRKEWPYTGVDGALVQTALPSWKAKSANFLGATLGAGQRSRFNASGTGNDALERLEAEAAFLGELVAGLSPEMVRLDEQGIEKAIRERREHDAARFIDYNHSPAIHPNQEPPRDLSPAELRERLDCKLYPRRDDRQELGEECDTLATRIGVVNEKTEEERGGAVTRYSEEILGADPSLDPDQTLKEAEAHFNRNVEAAYALEFRDEALKLFDEAREHGAIAAKTRRIVERPLAIEMQEIPHLFQVLARRLSEEPQSQEAVSGSRS